jgi:undecaprenyl-diphosphatase
MSPTDRLPLREAVALGLIQGPTELLPVSSSSHTTLIPWLLRWHCAELDPEARRGFEVALHVGTAAALLTGADYRGIRSTQAVWVVTIALMPPAVVGYLLESTIDRRLGGPLPIAVGLAVGGALMAASDRRPDGHRAVAQAGGLDGLVLGIAQSFALVPGISRSGSTLAAARARGFDRTASSALSRRLGVPVIAAAGVLKVGRALRRRGAIGVSPPLLLGGAAAFVSTLASLRALDRIGGSGRGDGIGALTPYGAYRIALATVVLRRLRAERSDRPPGAPSRDGATPSRDGAR